jgi:hypothetical protein
MTRALQEEQSRVFGGADRVWRALSHRGRLVDRGCWSGRLLERPVAFDRSRAYGYWPQESAFILPLPALRSVPGAAERAA